MSKVRFKEQRTLGMTITSDFGKLAFLADKFPDIHVGVLSSVAAFGRNMLRNDFLEGQELKYHVGQQDKMGRNVITGKVIKGMKVVIRSYPLNLFERGRRLRSGKKEAPKRILLVKFRTLLEARLGIEANTIYERHLNRATKAIGL
jgi:hypothetical protein